MGEGRDGISWFLNSSVGAALGSKGKGWDGKGRVAGWEGKVGISKNRQI